MTDGIWGHQAGFTSGEPDLLAEAYRNSLKSAVSKGLKTIAFPSISTGAYGYPIEKASRIALTMVKEFLERGGKLDKVIFVLFTRHDFEIYMEAAREIL